LMRVYEVRVTRITRTLCAVTRGLCDITISLCVCVCVSQNDVRVYITYRRCRRDI
jgi:hypothetical protein